MGNNPGKEKGKKISQDGGDGKRDSRNGSGSSSSGQNGAESPVKEEVDDSVVFANTPVKKLSPDDFELLTVIGKGSFGKVSDSDENGGQIFH